MTADELLAAEEIATLRGQISEAYDALDGRLGCGDDPVGKAQKLLWACEAYVETEDALPEEFDSEDYSLSRSVAALVRQRDADRDEIAALRARLATVEAEAYERLASAEGKPLDEPR